MTYDDCLTMSNGLQQVVQPAFADIKDFEDKEKYIFHSKFVRAVSFNKKKLEPIIEVLRDVEKLSDEYKEYLEKRDEILAKFAKKDKDGAPEERIQMVNGQQRKSYNVPSLHDKSSEVGKKITKLEKDNDDVIQARKKTEAEIKEMLKEDVAFEPERVPWSMIPDGQDTPAMDGIMYMIEDQDGPEREPEKEKTKK